MQVSFDNRWTIHKFNAPSLWVMGSWYIVGLYPASPPYGYSSTAATLEGPGYDAKS